MLEFFPMPMREKWSDAIGNVLKKEGRSAISGHFSVQTGNVLHGLVRLRLRKFTSTISGAYDNQSHNNDNKKKIIERENTTIRDCKWIVHTPGVKLSTLWVSGLSHTIAYSVDGSTFEERDSILVR